MEGTRVVALTGTADVTADVIVMGAVAAAEGSGVEVRPDDVRRARGLGVDLARRLSRMRALGRRGELTWVDLECDAPQALVVLGLGERTPGDLRAAGAALARRARGLATAWVLATQDLPTEHLRAFAEGVLLGGPLPTAAHSNGPSSRPLVEALVATSARSADLAIDAGVAHAAATMAARRLVHTPSNRKSPDWLAQQAIALAAPAPARILEVPELAELGMGGLLAVGSGSARPPLLVHLEWAADDPADVGSPGIVTGGPPRAAEGPDRWGAGARPEAGDGAPLRHVVLVGKGITFDSGGLSLKPADLQVPMKTDMTGAAVVAATISALSRLPAGAVSGLRVTGLLCLAENLPGASAMRPGDVVRHHGGLTSEVLNTDAEGRLVLGDGLAWAVGELAADVLVDVATLTGAATLGLGRHYGALFSNRPGLARALREAGDAAGEPLWPLPLHQAYREAIASEVADQANADMTPGPGPGAITAALFLQSFVGDTPWAHLDVAGPARSDAERLDVPKGGTAFGVRALLRWLEAGAPVAGPSDSRAPSALAGGIPPAWGPA